jgi:hypothetical protein
MTTFNSAIGRNLSPSFSPAELTQDFKGINGSRIAQNIPIGGTFARGNIQWYPGVKGDSVLSSAAHVGVIKIEGFEDVLPKVPSSYLRDGTQEMDASVFFSKPNAVKFFELTGPNGETVDMLRVGTPEALNAHFTRLAEQQPTEAQLRSALAKPDATWTITTASRPATFALARGAPAPALERQYDQSDTTAAYQIKLVALPIKVQDIAADMEAVGLGKLEGHRGSWLAIQPIGGDAQNPSSLYKGYYLINKGVSGSASVPSGVSAYEAGNLVAGIDKRNGATKEKFEALLQRNKALRDALYVKYPTLNLSQLAALLHQHGFSAISFVSRETAATNLARLNQ